MRALHTIHSSPSEPTGWPRGDSGWPQGDPTWPQVTTGWPLGDHRWPQSDPGVQISHFQNNLSYKIRVYILFRKKERDKFVLIYLLIQMRDKLNLYLFVYTKERATFVLTYLYVQKKHNPFRVYIIQKILNSQFGWV